MANEKKNPDLNSKNPTSSKPDSHINKTTPGNSSGSGSKGTTDFGGSSRNSGSDMNKDKDMNKPGRAGFEASNRDPNLDRSSSKQTDSEVSGGGSPKNSPSSGTGRNH